MEKRRQDLAARAEAIEPKQKRVRLEKYSKLTLDQYFYKEWCRKKFMIDPDNNRRMNRILIAKGLNCRPRYPVDYDYARGMLLLHKPYV